MMLSTGAAAQHTHNASFADHAVLCRPDQLFEAATVLSCGPPGLLVPLIVATPPPETELQYGATYDQFIALHNQRREWMGRLALGRVESLEEAREFQKRLVDSQDSQKLLQGRLDPYRMWFEQRRRVEDIVKGLKVKSVLSLASIPEAELRPLATGGKMRARGERSDILSGASVVRWTATMCRDDRCLARHLCIHSLSGLVAIAWQFFQPSVPLPEERLDLSGDGIVELFPGLLTALRKHVPIRVSHSTFVPTKSVAFAATPAHPEREAIVIEAESDASFLVAVQYAFRYGANLASIAKPDHTPIKEALARMEALQQSLAANDTKRARHKGFVPLWEGALSLVTRLRHPPLQEIHDSVRDAVPRELVSYVGSSPLTAVTAGTPYHLLRRGFVDWRHKPIGHVTGDVYQVLLRDLYLGPRPDAPSFDLLFDAGFFPAETKGVAQALEGRVAWPLELSGINCNPDTLSKLCTLIAVELLYLNSHGTESGVVMMGEPVDRIRLGQAMQLPQFMRTIVFNNSCVSWEGMKNEFVRCGAGAYIGTLWSVGADEAASYAARVLTGIIGDRMPVAAALAAERSHEVSCMAYLMVGSIQAGLTKASTAPAPAVRLTNLDRARELLLAALEVAKESSYHFDPGSTALVQSLLAQAEILEGIISISTHRDDAQRLAELIIAKVTLLLRLEADGFEQKCRAELERALAVVDATKEVSPSDLDPDTVDWHPKASVQLIQLLARLEAAVGNTDAVKRHYVTLSDTPMGNPGYAGLYAEMSTFYKKQNDRDLALEYATRSLRAAEANEDPVTRAVDTTFSLGHLVQARIRMGELDAAKADAIRGIQLGKEIGRLDEEFEFTADVARIDLRLGLWAEAKKAIESCESLALRASNPAMDLSAIGMRVELDIALENWVEAAQGAAWGISKSERLQRWESAGDFHMNLVTVFESRNIRAEAREHAQFAQVNYRKCGHRPKESLALAAVHRLTHFNPYQVKLQW